MSGFEVPPDLSVNDGLYDLDARVSAEMVRPVTGISLLSPEGLADGTMAFDQNGRPMPLIEGLVMTIASGGFVRVELSYHGGRMRVIDKCALLLAPKLGFTDVAGNIAPGANVPE